MMRLADIQFYMGAPPAPVCERFQRQAGRLTLVAWRDAAFGSRDGWWCSIIRGSLWLGGCWTMGGEPERNEELARLLERYARLGDDAQVSA